MSESLKRNWRSKLTIAAAIAGLGVVAYVERPHEGNSGATQAAYNKALAENTKRLKDIDTALAETPRARDKLAILTLEGCGINRSLLATATPYNSFEPLAILHADLEKRYSQNTVTNHVFKLDENGQLYDLSDSEAAFCPDASYDYSHHNSATISSTGPMSSNG